MQSKKWHRHASQMALNEASRLPMPEGAMLPANLVITPTPRRSIRTRQSGMTYNQDFQMRLYFSPTLIPARPLTFLWRLGRNHNFLEFARPFLAYVCDTSLDCACNQEASSLLKSAGVTMVSMQTLKSQSSRRSAARGP